jgi:uncharacterized membrane protein YGL010W
MRTHQQYIDEYAASHRNHINQLIHLICVPAIFWATIAFGFLVPLGRYLPDISFTYAAWINLATLAAIPLLIFYARLGWSSLITGLVWLVASLAICLAIQVTGVSLLWCSVAVFVAAWIVQLIGHRVEGAKPSFFKDLLFLLIGPLFVQKKFNRWVLARARQED